jgi:YidC/Oxa1 family membrane protein insertase
MHILSSVFTQILLFLTNLTGDWFISIALITLVIKLLLFPLSIKQQRTQLLMANYTKARDILAQKFKAQSERVNTESMKIATKYKINPLSPFITLIAQAPVFFSLYFTVINLSVSVGSFLVPWVSSLHTVDNLHILPVIAGLIQGFSGFTAENKNWLMFVLPIAFGMVFLWKAPVALSAYWIVNSALRFFELKLFSLSSFRRKLFSIPTPEEMVKGI